MADQVWNGCVVPDDRLYDLDLHVWVRLDGDEAVLGMTDVAQTMGGRLVQVSWKRPGRTLRRGQTVGGRGEREVGRPVPHAAVGRSCSTVNAAAFEDDIAIGNRDPYGAGWMARVRPDALDEESAAPARRRTRRSSSTGSSSTSKTSAAIDARTERRRSGMDGKPEGTEQGRRGRRPWWLLALVVIFAGYLAFRLVQGLIWLVGQL